MSTTALVPELSWLSPPMLTFWDLSVWPLESFASSLFESNSVVAFTTVTRSATPSGSVRYAMLASAMSPAVVVATDGPGL